MFRYVVCVLWQNKANLWTNCARKWICTAQLISQLTWSIEIWVGSISGFSWVTHSYRMAENKATVSCFCGISARGVIKGEKNTRTIRENHHNNNNYFLTSDTLLVCKDVWSENTITHLLKTFHSQKKTKNLQTTPIYETPHTLLHPPFEHFSTSSTNTPHPAPNEQWLLDRRTDVILS